MVVDPASSLTVPVANLIVGDDGLYYRVASIGSVNWAACVGLCATTPGFRLPQAKTVTQMKYIKKCKQFTGCNTYLRFKLVTIIGIFSKRYFNRISHILFSNGSCKFDHILNC